MGELYLGRGTYEQFDEYIDFLNYVFGYNGNTNDMKKLLPKLYRRELAPATNSYVILEEGKIKATVGVYRNEVNVCGTVLTGVGVGNVAVHPYERSKGYMKRLMNTALDNMVEEEIDFTVLGGQRQRYNYFSYENAGVCYSFQVSKKNIRHAFGERRAPFRVEEVREDDEVALDAIAKISSSKLYVPIRDRNELYSILCSWNARPYIIMDEDRVVGYCVLSQQEVTEFLTARDEEFLDALCSVIEYIPEKNSTMNILLPAFLPAYIKSLENIAEKVSVEHCKMFSILRFRRVIEAYLNLKAKYTQLPEGELPVLVHGRGGDERFLIAVKEGEISVTETQMEPVIELSHIEAMNYFFAPVCGQRKDAAYYTQCWFPLPLWIYAADRV